MNASECKKKDNRLGELTLKTNLAYESPRRKKRFHHGILEG